jgi:hypothetical protein
MKSTIRFFGDYGPLPHERAPVGLRCYHCAAPFELGDQGVCFMREQRACYASHRACFIGGAVRELHHAYR